ncbi:MAG: class I SAM-dependent methyltransferase [Myxococcota bacterium]
MTTPPLDKEAQREFLDGFYGWAGPIYDLSRKYYLLGRDPALERLLRSPWNRLVEVGPGTGRNLEKIHRARPFAALGGVEPSRAMLRRVRKRCPYATLIEGFAEDTPYAQLLGAPPDRVLFSYCLSMVQDPDRAVDQALREVAPGGKVVVVDFGDLGEMLDPFRSLLKRWLHTFHVTPLAPGVLERPGTQLDFGPGRYWVYAEIPAGE